MMLDPSSYAQHRLQESNAFHERTNLLLSTDDDNENNSSFNDSNESYREVDEVASESIRQSWRVWIAFFLLGTINNTPYVVVASAAKSIVNDFHVPNLIGVVQWANVAFGGFARALNLAMENVSFEIRVILNSAFMLMGLVVLSFSSRSSFLLAVCAIIMVGASSSFGESAILCYLKQFSGSQTGAWSSGTGMAGVVGSLYFVVTYSVFNLPDGIVFLMMAPLAFVYWLCFKVAKSSAPAFAFQDDALSRSKSTALSPPIRDDVVLTEGRWHRSFRCLKIVASPAFQLCLVYFLEYCISVLFASVADRGLEPSESWFRKNSYEILATCYQAGVLISRSSVGVFRVRRLHIITLLQLVNFVIWGFHACVHPFLSLWWQFILMVCVGLLGGAMYVNVFFMLTDPENNPIPPHDREMCINITAFFITIGIVSSSVFEIAACATFMNCSS